MPGSKGVSSAAVPDVTALAQAAYEAWCEYATDENAQVFMVAHAEALLALVERLQQERDEALTAMKSVHVGNLTDALVEAERERDVAAARARELEQALEAISAQQPKTLSMIERNGFVFDSLGQEPGNWQHLAFTIYTDLCATDTIARAALEERE